MSRKPYALHAMTTAFVKQATKEILRMENALNLKNAQNQLAVQMRNSTVYVPMMCAMKLHQYANDA
jgi:hypothetical protein